MAAENVVVTLEVIQDDKVGFFGALLDALGSLNSHATFRVLSIEFRRENDAR